MDWVDGGVTRMKLRKKLVYLFSVTVTLMMLIVVVFSSTQVESSNQSEIHENRILFISSYSSAFPTYFQQIDGLMETFEGYPVTIDVEFMDSKRFYNDENIENFKELLTYKLSQTEYDLVITSDDNAINFVMEHRDDLLPGIPIIFFGVNNTSNASAYAQETGVTGVVEGISIEDTIDLALALNPNAQNIIALSDNTTSGQSDLVRFYDVESDYNDYTFGKIDMSELSMAEFLSELSQVNDDSVLILLSALKDVDNVTYDFEDSLELMLEEANQPIYHLFEHGIEDGLIGGKVVSHYSQAQTAAYIAISVLDGTNIDDFSLVDDSPNVYMINYEVFNEYNYSSERLPNDVEFINREYNIFERYTGYIVTAGIFLIFQTVIIITLVVSVSNRNKARLEVLHSKERLELAYTDLEDANEKLSYKSYHDDLTGLFNRNYFEVQYPKLKEMDGIPVSIILLDVNGLKLINDAFGHISGDKVLIETANLLLKLFVNSDIFRIGGDEFAVFPYGKSESSINILIKKLDREIKKIKIEGVSLSVSVGYASMKENKTLREMFTEAEDWMYREKLNQVPSNRSSIIEAIIATINQKDEYSEAHSKRVSKLSVKISEFMAIGENITSVIRTAGLLHDIGKIIVPTSILNKEGRLTPKEYSEIKKHSEIGYRILNSVSTMRDIAQYVFCHHERPDGLGYPRGLKGDKIPIQSRIIGVADAIDAMLTDRLYRNKLSEEDCIKELRNNKGTQFCSKTIDVVLKNFKEIVAVIEET